MMEGASGYLWMNVKRPVSQPTSSTLELKLGSVGESSSEELGSDGRRGTNWWVIAFRRCLCIFLTIDVANTFLFDFGGDGAKRPYRPAREFRF